MNETMQEVRRCDLPPTVKEFADRYDEVVGIRDRFLWKWFYFLNPYFRLSTVKTTYEQKVRDEKTLLTIYVTLLDDLIDDQNDRITYQEVAKIPFKHQPINRERDGVDEDCLGLAADVWSELELSLRMAPQFRMFIDLFRFDLRQTVNAVRYAYIANNYPYVVNMKEAYAYGSHNMVLLAFSDIDLMHSPQFNREEFAPLRSTLWKAQEMTRIGNWVSTWRRELSERDFTSGVLVYARENGVITDEDLRQLWANPTADIVDSVCERIERADVEGTLLEQWQRHYEELERASELGTVNCPKLLEGMETVMQFHLDSEGMK